MEIRKAKPEEIKELIKAQYENEARYDPAIHVTEEGLKTIIKWMGKKLATGEAILLMACEEKPIGYVFAYVEHKNRNIWKYDFGKIADIHVLPGYRGKGIGKSLMDRVLEWFKEKGLKEATLEVAYENRGAIAFYERMGFKIGGLVMRKQLS